jgi:hypothetical protein
VCDSEQEMLFLIRQIRREVEAKLGFTYFKNKACWTDSVNNTTTIECCSKRKYDDPLRFNITLSDDIKCTMFFKFSYKMSKMFLETMKLYQRFVNKLLKGMEFNYMLHCLKNGDPAFNLIPRGTIFYSVLERFLETKKRFNASSANIFKEGIIGETYITKYDKLPHKWCRVSNEYT